MSLSGTSTYVLIRHLGEEISAMFHDGVATIHVDDPYEQAAISFEEPKDPEAGNHNYLNISGHYGHGNNRVSRSIGKSRRGFNSTKFRKRQNN